MQSFGLPIQGNGATKDKSRSPAAEDNRMRRILFCAILLLTNTDAKALLGECVVINDDVNNNSPG